MDELIGVPTVFIPVRGGSKGIPGKNLMNIGGRPLVDWVVDAALNATSISKVVVSTDDEAIAAHVASSFPDAVVFRRGAETATDKASTESAMAEYLAADADADPFVLLQATSPLTTAADIDAAIALLADADSVVSVVRQKRFQWREGADGAEPIGYEPVNRPRRQDYDGFLVENGAVYVTTRAGFASNNCRLNGRIALHEMHEDTYAELDEPADIAVIDAALRRRHEPNDLSIRAARIRLVITDVDGCLTDNGMYYGADGELMKRFSARDGKGFELLRNAGVKTMLLTSEHGPIAQRRAEKLQVELVELGCADKLAAADRVRKELGLDWDEIAFLGDDVHDVELLKAVGLSACPADATPEAMAVATYVCNARGGFGAFRDLADLAMGVQERSRTVR